MKELLFRILMVSFFTGLFILFWLSIRTLINKKFSYKINRFIWLAIAVRMIFFVSLPIPSFSQRIEISLKEETPSYESVKPNKGIVNTTDTRTVIAMRNQPDKRIAVSNNMIEIITIIWSGGFIISLSIKFLSYILLCKKVKNGKFADSAIQNIFIQCSERLKNKHPVNIVILDEIPSPLILGYFNKTIVLPQISYSERELDYIFAHEIVHGMNNDIWYKFICVFATSLHWFNPFSYLLVIQAEKDLEYHCDMEVIRGQNISYRKDYCSSILSLMEKGKIQESFHYGISLTNNFDYNKNTVKLRMENILNMKNKKSNKLIIAAIVAVLLLCTSLFSLGNTKGSTFIKSFLYGDKSVTFTDPKDYGKFEDLRGYSSLDIFPKNLPSSMIDEYYYTYQDTLFDPTCQIYLSCSYDKSGYEAELKRLSQISKSYKGNIQKVLYDTDNYNYPAYVTIDGNNHCYEYALLTGENKITYIFLDFIDEKNLKFDLQYLPKNYENEKTDKKRGYTIYNYYKDNGDGIWIDE
jgi:beta-lactamase regulating signal transducer with metallopeptidase domain